MPTESLPDMQPHSAHWGAFFARWDGRDLQVQPHPEDLDPNPLIENLQQALRHRARISAPVVRKGWLEDGPGPDDRRGNDEFVQVSWDQALQRLAGELQRIKDAYGPGAVFGGSYGWSSAGRFHHAQSQVHRFLNTALGGYVRSANSYSAGASMVLLPHILGPFDEVCRRNVTWEQVIEHTQVVLAFGGMALRNSRIASGGVSRHIERDAMRSAAERGCRFVNVSPLRTDLPPEARPEWLPIEPGTDTALILALIHVLVREGLHDRAFLDGWCEGWPEFERYVLGADDGCAKTPQWAEAIVRVPAARIESLARELAQRRVLVVTSHSLQRAEHGEQPVWAAAVLASVLGQIGLPGGGLANALGTMAHYGRRANAVPTAALPQGRNGVEDFIPVARIADMLLHPGATYDYNGQARTYPRIRLAYWAGGNPFHHHQDLQRLRRAVCRLDTFVVHDFAWTASARHADIVLPSTMSLEREDIGATPTDPLMIAMHRVAPPFAQARDDFEIFSELAHRLGAGDQFTEGRRASEWLRHLYEPTRLGLQAMGWPAPAFDEFWERGSLQLPQRPDDGGMLRRFREDPRAHPLPTPSGRIQITSAAIAGFRYADCPGHPTWLSREDGPRAAYPLTLVANQPATRLHSQFDFGSHSSGAKRRGREVCAMHPADAAARAIGDGELVRLFNARGACLACVRVTEDVLQGVVQLSTGAWYDPRPDADGTLICVHGNPNILTRDRGTSSLAQGCTGQLTAVQVERYQGEAPAVRAFCPPA